MGKRLTGSPAKWLRVLVLVSLVSASVALMGPSAQAVPPSTESLPRLTGFEIEPNETPAAATPITGSDRVRGTVNPTADIDVYSFAASTGDRVYAATVTSGSPASTDSVLDVIGSDGTTVLESDNDDGSFGPLSSSVAGVAIPSSGTYYIRVGHLSATDQIRPYDLYVQTRSGAPTAETEPNNAASPQTLPPSGWVSGTVDPAGDSDRFTVSLNAGDTAFLTLDMDPERDGTTWNGRLGLGLFGTPPFLLQVDDPSTTSPNSEAFVATVDAGGTYVVNVAESSSGGSPNATYHLSVTVVPAQTSECRVYDSADMVPIPDSGSATSPISVPDDVRLARVAVEIDLDHALMQDLDIALQTPAGNDIALLTDVGSSTSGTQTHMRLRLDDAAAVPPSFAILEGQMVQPEATAGRLAWTNGEMSGGTWNLVLTDDKAGDTGALSGWSLIACEAEQPSEDLDTIYSSDFESDDGGFTHSGTLDEWERGLPSLAPITSCASGTSCWKTDLDNTYDASSSQDLLSPPISLVGVAGPIELSWAQRYQMENASFDHFFVDVQEVGGSNPRRLFEWTGPTMTQAIGNPPTTLQQSAGWGTSVVDVSEFAGHTIEIRFHLDSNASGQLAGVAIDDVSVHGQFTDKTLQVDKAGSGSGTVTSSPPGINCGSDCSEAYVHGTEVTLTATPAGNSTFAGWSGGGCSGTGTCTVTMDADMTVTATFDVAQRTLQVDKAGSGSGTVTSSPAGIHCGADCSQDYAHGTEVTLTATSSANSTFVGWLGGGCSGTGPCTVTMDADKTVQATFTVVSAPSPSPGPAASCRGTAATIAGTAGNDSLIGTNGPDVIAGLGGDDTISGLGGKDIICAGGGSDAVRGGGGGDTLKGQEGDDRLNGGGGRDRLGGGRGNDNCIGGPGQDASWRCEKHRGIP